MEVSKKRCEMIGSIIRIYRKEQLSGSKGARWTQASFCKDICSIGTLSSIEKGNICRFMDVYPALLAKFNLEFGEFPIVDTALDQLIDELYVAVEYYRKEDIVKIIQKALKILSNIKEFVYYADLHNIFMHLKLYYVQDKLLPYTYIQQLLSLFCVLPKKLEDILKVNIFNCTYRYRDDKEFLKVYTKLDIPNNSFICCKIQLLMYYMFTDNGIEFIKLSHEIEKELEDSKNYIRLFDVYNNCIAMMTHLGKGELSKYIDRAEQLIDMGTIPTDRIAVYYYNSGISLYTNKEYENAYKKLAQSIQYDDADLFPNILFMASCCSRMNVTMNIPVISPIELANYSKRFRYIYEYFTMDENVSVDKKQAYIMDTILPELEAQEPLFVEMFRYELNNLMCVTNQYKDGYIYDLRTREILQS